MKTLYIFLFTLVLVVPGISQTINAQNSVTDNKIVSQAALSNLTATEGANGVQISWTSLNEANMSSHEIQKSANGTSFMSIGSVSAQNNSTPFRYSYVDATPVESVNYYRLLSTDRRGVVTYSDIVKVDNSFRKTAVAITPNPVKGGVLNLQLNNFSRGQYAISLYSNGGQKVFARSMDLTDGTSTQTINLPQNITRGLYFFQVTDGRNRMNMQVVVE